MRADFSWGRHFDVTSADTGGDSPVFACVRPCDIRLSAALCHPLRELTDLYGGWTD